MSLVTDVHGLIDSVHAVDRLNMAGDDTDFVALAMIRDARVSLMYTERELEQKLAGRMKDKRHTVEGVATFERRKRTDRKQWDTEALKSAVLDSRLVDRETGEVVEETPLERILHVWRLDAPRVTALRDRGIDADQFCHAEPAGYQIQIIN